MKKTIDDYINLVELLRQALLFYGDGNSYNNNVPSHNKTKLKSLIDSDNGSQARFALEKIIEFQKNWEFWEKQSIDDIINDDKSILDIAHFKQVAEDIKNNLKNGD